MENVLQMHNITKRFPGVLALDHVNIDLKKGEVLGICGENGAGKSTLMKVLSGSYSHGEYDGDIYINGKQTFFVSVSDAQHHGIEMVYQEMNMMLDASIAENLFVGNLPGSKLMVDYKKLYRDTEALLKKAKLNLDPSAIVRPLNSGQMQLLSLCRACAKKPKILVLDEPTTALTDSEVDTLMEILREMKESGVSVIYISHKLEELFRICDRVTVMRDGRVISTKKIEDVGKECLVEEMVGRKVANFYPKEHHEIGEEFFQIEHLTVPHPNIKGVNIVEDISFGLRRGEILGIGGLVGAGRSEILQAIFGQITKGVSKQIFINGKEIHINNPKDAIRHGIGFVTEERKQNGIIWMLSIRENMILPSLADIPGKLFVNKKVEAEKVKGMFNKLNIKAPSLETTVVNLSGGNQQKVIMAKWMLKAPTVFLIDEPTKGIDVGAKAEIYKFLSDLTAQGASIILVSSDMPELINMADRCLVLSRGKIMAELTGDEITDRAIMNAAI